VAGARDASPGHPRRAGATAGDLALARALVQPTLAARSPFEMFHRIRDVHRPAVDTRVPQRPIEQLPGRPDEGASGPILPISRLLAAEHDRRRARTLAENGLRRLAVEVAPGASGR